MKTGLDSSYSKSFCTHSTCRLPAHIGHTSPNKNYRKNRSTGFLLSDLWQLSWISYLSRSVCLRTNRLNHCSYHNHFHNITHMLLTNPYVIVIALDFSKAFDTVRHHTLLAKMAQLDIPDHVYNWLVNFFDVHSHQTKYADDMSTIKSISASIIQGSAIGPASLGLCCKRIWFTSSHQWQPSV